MDKKTMGIGNKLKKARLTKGFTQSQVAELADIYQQRYQKYESGKLEPNINMIRILARVLDVNSSWLIEDIPVTELPAQCRLVPLITTEDILKIINRREINPPGPVIPFPTSDTTAFAITVEDDSMAPEFVPGDIVIIDPAIRYKIDDYILSLTSGKAYIRKYIAVPKMRNLRLLQPVNPNYESFPVRSNQSRPAIRIIGKVVGKIKKY